MHFIDLEVRMGDKEEKVRFLVTDLRNEDLILGYPWLAVFEPQFNWWNSVIDTTHLPIVIHSLDWRKGCFQPVVARVVAGRQIASKPLRLTYEEKVAILPELEDKCAYTRGISTDLATDARQYTRPVKLPAEYLPHAKVFSKAESR
jgi:hypothetical protein